MSKATEKRDRTGQALLEAACARIAESGLSGINIREMAEQAGCSVGTVYNIYGSLDGLIVAANGVILRHLDVELSAAASASSGSPEARLLALGRAYLGFVVRNTNSWYAVFEHKMPAGERIPDWHLDEHVTLFRHVAGPLSELDPSRPQEEVALLARSIYSAVHGIVSLGLEDRLSAISPEVLANQVDLVVSCFAAGFRWKDS